MSESAEHKSAVEMLRCLVPGIKTSGDRLRSRKDECGRERGISIDLRAAFQALDSEYDVTESEGEVFIARFNLRPDAYRIDPSTRTFDCYEVEHRHPVTDDRLKQYFWFRDALEELELRLWLFDVRDSHLRQFDFDALCLNSGESLYAIRGRLESDGETRTQADSTGNLTTTYPPTRE